MIPYRLRNVSFIDTEAQQMSSQAYFCDVLDRRTKRLSQMIDIGAPKQMISQEVALVMEAAMGYCPDDMTIAFSNWLTAVIRHKAGFCMSCDNKTVGSDIQCETCRSADEIGTD